MQSNSIHLVAQNKKASFNYFLEDKYQAGLVLTGTEIKSIRKGKVSIVDSYVKIMNNEVFIINMFIDKYDKGALFNHEPTRTRKLLLTKKEIRDLMKNEIKGYTFIPTSVVLVRGRAKIIFHLAKGKHLYDKREDQKKKDIIKNLRNNND